jgi:hypothetical protein
MTVLLTPKQQGELSDIYKRIENSAYSKTLFNITLSDIQISIDTLLKNVILC